MPAYQFTVNRIAGQCQQTALNGHPYVCSPATSFARWGQAGVGVARCVQKILIHSAGHPHTGLAGTDGAMGTAVKYEPALAQ
jgi:hypothetical protein